MKTDNLKKPTERPDFHRGHEISVEQATQDVRSGCSGTLLYFAYGSNMNPNQMSYRCPGAEEVGSVRLEGYRLAFRTNGSGNGVATILPEEGSYVDGVLWQISEWDEQYLDHYEGFPNLYEKESVTVINQDGQKQEVMTYTMNSPYKDIPALPSDAYLMGILFGCLQHKISREPVLEAVRRTQQELPQKVVPHKKHRRRKNKER